ncbi:hypothetical protein AGOR_G00004260 [Albula goreensis]|uniref:Uncharacterized protein n=1 Tax=Albula goreensis TaxID=1534307 RepID=A0A8T3E4H3_9TELE|nr:hypothetical protein AGOR_G00004260 [Albula goreensis]
MRRMRVQPIDGISTNRDWRGDPVQNLTVVIVLPPPSEDHLKHFTRKSSRVNKCRDTGGTTERTKGPQKSASVASVHPALMVPADL